MEVQLFFTILEGAVRATRVMVAVKKKKEALARKAGAQ